MAFLSSLFGPSHSLSNSLFFSSFSLLFVDFFFLLFFVSSGVIGQYEFVKKGDAPVMGITKLEGVTEEELRRPRRKLPAVAEGQEQEQERGPQEQQSPELSTEQPAQSLLTPT